MSFFLLGKGPDDHLWLLSPKPVGSRQEAMAELSRLTADPGFEHWDAEVLVMELDKGTPVLLVRPASVVDAAVPEPEAEPAEEPAAEPAEEPAAEPAEVPDAEPAEEAEAEAAAEAEQLHEVPAEPSDEVADTDPALAAVIEDLHTDETPDAEPSGDVEADEDVVVEADEDAVVVEADEVPLVEPVEPIWAEAVVEQLGVESSEDESGSLKDALKRTAAQMESEGIVAPESVGPTDGEIPADTYAAPEAPAEAPNADEAAAWPWDTAAADSGFSLDAIEEPARDATPLVTAAGDDETVSASRPVILGSYGESETVPLSEAALAEVPLIEPVATEPAAPDTSDFILDLEPPGGGETTPPDLAAEPLGIAPAATMTCDDCVYVRTCPNTGQRDPGTCGSFQWK